MKKIICLTIMLIGFLTTYGQQCVDGDCQNIPISRTQGWSASHGTPSWGTNSVWLWSHLNRGEGVNYSGYNFVQGEEYCISFNLIGDTHSGQVPNGNMASFNVVLSQNQVTGNLNNTTNTTPNLPNPNQVIQSQNIWTNGANPQQFTFTFVATQNFDNLWFYADASVAQNDQVQVTLANVNICHVTCEDNQDVAFHFENENGVQNTVFNLCEDVYLDGAATLNTGSYFMDLWQVNTNGTVSWISKQSSNGWVSGNLNSPINITDLFKNNGAPNVTFQAGTTYEVKLAINHPDCGWSFETHRFTYQDTSMSSNFTLDYYCHDGVYDVTVTATDIAPNQWWLLLETNVQGSILDTDTIGQASTIQGGTTTTFTNLDPNKSYYIKHGVWTTNCPWQETRIALEPDCCTDAPEIFPYCDNPCALDSFPLKVKDKNGNIITALNGATFSWTNTVTGVTSTNDIVIATDSDQWELTLTMTDGCIYNLNYTVSCCNDNIQLKAYKCPTESDAEVLKSQLENKELSIDKANVEKHINFLNTYTEGAESCDPCDTGLFIIKVVDGSGNLVTNFNSIIWSDGLYANQNIRWGNVDTLYTVTVVTPSSNGLETCTYKDEIIYECEVNCENLTAPVNLAENGTTLSWDPVPGAVSYIVSSPSKIEVKCCEVGISIAPIQTTTNSITLSSSLQKTCFVWQVTAVCSDGSKSPVSKQKCHVPKLIEEGNIDIKSSKERILIYPNPSKGDINIKTELTDISNITLTIYRTDGALVRTIKNIELRDKQLNMNFQTNLPKGIYLFNFHTGKGTIVKQVIIE